MTWSDRTNTETPRACCFLQRPSGNSWEANSTEDWLRTQLLLRTGITAEIDPSVVLTPLTRLTRSTRNVNIWESALLADKEWLMTQRVKTTEEWIKWIQEFPMGHPETRYLDFRKITRRTGASTRNLRYVLDHHLLGEGVFTSKDKIETGYGVVRQFSVCSSFVLSLAGVMLEAGLRSGLIHKAITGLFNWATSSIDFRHGPSLAPFLVFVWSKGLIVEIGDGANIRIRVHAGRLTNIKPPCPKSTGWRTIDSGSPVAGKYKPLVSLRLDLGAIRNKLD
jgi:hypothetical protein